MCGLAGFWSPEPRGDARSIAEGMAARLVHRGPDAGGCWVDDDAGVALAHRRLSIVDLSPAGAQPMVSPSGRFVISFNGEVYNHEELRRELAGDRHRVRFRGRSDTEVMLAAVEAWGIAAAIDRFVGMFAFALWDRVERELHLVRDRLGVKPLYYGWARDTLVFASELDALAAHPGFAASVSRDAVALLLRYAYIPAPHTIYERTHKLPPATRLRVRGPRGDAMTAVTYWRAGDVAARGQAEPFEGTPQEAVTAVERLLTSAVGLRMVADVPVGVFLSGGIDSSTVAALMQAQSRRPIRTFTIGSFDAEFDEAAPARAVARHLGTDHTELYVTPEAARDVVPELPRIYDEPFADSSQIPTYLVSKLARRHVTVALSGDGGDEVFGGYNRHVWGGRVWRAIRLLGPAISRRGAAALTAVPPERWTAAFRMADRILPSGWRPRTPGDKLHKLAGALAAATPDELYDRLAARCERPGALVHGAGPLPPGPSAPAGLDDLTARMMYLDLVTYLPDDILTKVDRASMACSLEAREPLLDHRLVELAWRLPVDLKVRQGGSKWPLRQVLYRHVPRKLVDRAKAGFGLPIGAWLRGPLREWVEDLLDERALAAEGYFDTRAVRAIWQEHGSGRRNRVDELWSILMFQAWYRAQACRIAPAPAPAARMPAAVPSAPPPRVRLAYVTTVPVTQWAFLCGQNAYLAARGYEIHAISSPGRYLDALAARDGITVHPVPLTRTVSPAADLVALWRLFRLFRRMRPDIAHVSTPKAALLGGLAAAAAGVPVRIFCVRGTAAGPASGMPRRVYRFAERLTARLCHQAICVSTSLLEFARSEAILPPGRGIVVANGMSNGIDVERFSVSSGAVQRAPVGLRQLAGNGAVVAGYVGRLARDKGIEILWHAWSVLRRDHPGLHLLLVGPWEQQDAVSSACRASLESDDRVHIAGPVDDVRPFYRVMSFFVLPSFSEGFPNAPMEAAAMELPVISTRAVGARDAVEDGVTGMLVPPRDVDSLVAAMRTYIDDPGLRRRHGLAGCARVRRDFRREAIWEALHDEYVRLLAEAGLLARDAGAVSPAALGSYAAAGGEGV